MSAGTLDARVARGMARQLEWRRERIAGGERPIGWKVGFGAPAALEKFALDGPLVGFLTDAGLLESGAECSLDGWTKPMLEAEVAVQLARDVPGGSDRDAARAAIAGLDAAIELADLEPPPEDVEEILAGNIFHRHVVLGPVRDELRSVEGTTARVVRNGEEAARTDDPEALTGELIDVLRHVATLLAACGEALRAGEVVIMGSVVPPMPVERGDSVTVELPPLGALAVELT